MPRILSYKKTAQKILEEIKDTLPMKKNVVDGLKLVEMIYDYIINTDDEHLKPTKEMFKKYYISKSYTRKTVRKMLNETKKNLLIGNKVFVPSFGYYGTYQLKNKKGRSIFNVRLACYSYSGKKKGSKTMLLPSYEIYMELLKAIKKHPYCF